MQRNQVSRCGINNGAEGHRPATLSLYLGGNFSRGQFVPSSEWTLWTFWTLWTRDTG